MKLVLVHSENLMGVNTGKSSQDYKYTDLTKKNKKTIVLDSSNVAI